MIRKETDTHEAIRALKSVIADYKTKLRKRTAEDICIDVLTRFAAITTGGLGAQQPVSVRHILRYVPSGKINPDAECIPHMITQLRIIRDMHAAAVKDDVAAVAEVYEITIDAIENKSDRIPIHAILFFLLSHWGAGYRTVDGTIHRMCDCTSVYRLAADLCRMNARDPEPGWEQKADEAIETLEEIVAKAENKLKKNQEVS